MHFVELTTDGLGRALMSVLDREDRAAGPQTFDGHVADAKNLLRTLGRSCLYDLRALDELGYVSSDFALPVGLRTLVDTKSRPEQLFRDSGLLDRSRRVKGCCDTLVAHRRASELAGVDRGVSEFDVIPTSVFFDLHASVLDGMADVWERVTDVQHADYPRRENALMVLRSIESSGIAVDVSAVADATRAQALSRFARSVLLSQKDGMLRVRFDNSGVKTGRYRVEDGVNVMSVPKGVDRDLLVSRFGEQGEIVVVDANAVDYRCIVAATGEPEFQRLYHGCDDFHRQTCVLLFDRDPPKEVRDAIKKFTYVAMYGGSAETLVSSLGMGPELVRTVMEKMRELMAPVERLRRRLYESSRQSGFVTLHDGSRVAVGIEDHPGKVLGLFAQGYSSRVFESMLGPAVTLINMRGLKSRVIFTVHDELVIDQHVAEREQVDRAIGFAATWAAPYFVPTVKRGRTYGRAS